MLEVKLYDEIIGNIVILKDGRSLFSFSAEYINNIDKPTLSQSFLSESNNLILRPKAVSNRLLPYFSNLLPEGALREYLAQKGGISPLKENLLLSYLGSDLPGAITVSSREDIKEEQIIKHGSETEESILRFSLAGVQMKFSALYKEQVGLTIPSNGVGGDWIIKLPSFHHKSVPENEFAMMTLAKLSGIDTPAVDLVELQSIKGLPSSFEQLMNKKCLTVQRFDRNRGAKIHMEDFAQVYGVYPEDKYKKVSYANIANMVWILTGEAGLVEFVKRLTFSTLIGNGDMHLKNWSFIYPDRVTPALSPAYDLVSTIPYIHDDKLALSLAGQKDMQSTTIDHFKTLAKKAAVPERLVVKVVKEFAKIVRDNWESRFKDFELDEDIKNKINSFLKGSSLLDPV